MSGPGFHPPPPQGDEVPARKVLLVLAAVLVLFALAVWATLPILRWGAPPRGGDAQLPLFLGQAEVGRVNQKPFELDTRARALRRRQLERLSTYGWVDRQAGVIHLPVERAVELLLLEAQEEQRE